jgi:2-keto-3-deoxy-L-rhamnonate aldolase RhmA
MQTPQNAFKRRLLARELQIGLWCSLGSNIAAEIVGTDIGLLARNADALAAAFKKK